MAGHDTAKAQALGSMKPKACALAISNDKRQNRRTRAGKEKLDERQKTCRLQCHVRGAGYPDGGRAAADRAVPRNWQARQLQAGERRRCRRR